MYKLQMLDSADTIDDLRSPPGNRLEKLSGDRLGRWSIRINNQWRICFRFENGNAYDVEVVDMRPIHPSEILLEEFLVPLNMSAHALAMALRVPAPRVNDIVRERRAITPDTALRLARYFGTSAEFWLNLQIAYDLRRTRRELGVTIEQEVSPHMAV